MITALQIIQCSDVLMWYNGMQGTYVPFLRETITHYWSREPDGYSNIIMKHDAVLVEIDESTPMYSKGSYET